MIQVGGRGQGFKGSSSGRGQSWNQVLRSRSGGQARGQSCGQGRGQGWESRLGVKVGVIMVPMSVGQDLWSRSGVNVKGSMSGGGVNVRGSRSWGQGLGVGVRLSVGISG